LWKERNKNKYQPAIIEAQRRGDQEKGLVAVLAEGITIRFGG
jgi:hypothetical protein